ncbi:hypothetical protein KHA80_08725 [Anaerobacillus sp. HL2]|nr:hypothetical protein KHA80_08725 [Anaerobacillus sp. HL2]
MGIYHGYISKKELMTEDYFLEQYTTTLNNLELFISELLNRDYATNLMMLAPMVNSMHINIKNG